MTWRASELALQLGVNWEKTTEEKIQHPGSIEKSSVKFAELT